MPWAKISAPASRPISLPRTIPRAVRELCLAFPETEETVPYARPDFKVAGKSFACFCVNHHGDGRVALWLRAPEGAQQHYVGLDPDSYFVPQYLGPRGWLGVELNKGLSWDEIAARVREAWEHVAPALLVSELGDTQHVAPPDVEMTPEEINPLLAESWRGLLEELGSRCTQLPEVTEDSQFGRPVWKAGRKTFAGAFHESGRLHFNFWVRSPGPDCPPRAFWWRSAGG